jgi:hyperosmotically inducible protein
MSVNMKNRIIAGAFAVFVIASPIAAVLADGDQDRSHPMTFVKDSVITTKVKAKLANEKAGSLVHIQVDTDSDGAVYLSGNARTAEAASKAVEIARGTEGVTSVKSTVRVKKDD